MLFFERGANRTLRLKREESTGDGMAFCHSVSEKEGDVIGPYTLRQEIGAGGFGVVWMAEQSEPISRMVALKVVKAGMDTREVLARFEAERQALAMMEHPNIAKVLDAGATPGGRPWFAMELVKGIPITEFCDQQKFDTRQRLELFRDVCGAVNHAHQKGIIHRDLKPSNVMVTLHGDKPVVKVIDFGIAKATQSKLTDKTLFTRFEQFLGTPVYMSPEQAAMSGLDIDTRSDIYALGVLLYELLAGRPPFDPNTLVSAGYDEMRRIIREEDPPSPSTRLNTLVAEESTRVAEAHRSDPQKLGRLLHGELDWIVMKSIDKDRSRRYETANALAEDIGRFLEDEPVQAAAPSSAYRFSKFARRHKAALGVAALITLILVAATAVSVRQAIRASAAEKLASNRLAESEKAREEAEAISGYLANIFKRPESEQDGRAITAAAMLDRAAARLGSELENQPERRNQLRIVLAGTYQSLGLYKEMIPLLEAVDAHFVSEGNANSLEALDALHQLAHGYEGVLKFEEAYSTMQRELDLREETQGSDDPELLKGRNCQARMLMALAKPEQAWAVMERNLAVAEEALGSDHKFTVMSRCYLVALKSQAGYWEEAIPLQETLLEVCEKIDRLEGSRVATFTAKMQLAASYLLAGRAEEALELYEWLLEKAERTFGQSHPHLLSARADVAKALHAAGRHEEAFEMRRELLPLHLERFGPDDLYTSIQKIMLAESYAAAGDEEAAFELRVDALASARRGLPPNHVFRLKAMHHLALSYLNSDRVEEAVQLEEEALSHMDEGRFWERNPQKKDSLETLAACYEKAGRGDEARLLRDELAVFRAPADQVHGAWGLGSVCAPVLRRLLSASGEHDRVDVNVVAVVARVAAEAQAGVSLEVGSASRATKPRARLELRIPGIPRREAHLSAGAEFSMR